MAYVHYNPNPSKRNTVDCTIRAICKALDQDWHTTYIGLALEGYLRDDMPEANHVWGAYLRRNGFARRIIPDTRPECYTVSDFATDNPIGTYVLGLSSHVVTIVNGDWYDSWDSGQEIPIYYLEEDRHAI